MEKSYFGPRIDKKGECSFRIFAPQTEQAELIIDNNAKPIAMSPAGNGFYETTLSDIAAGTRYSFNLDAYKNIPDPASRWQPEGIKGVSAVVDHHFFDWQGDHFPGMPMNEMVIYEAHVGSFSADHSFRGVLAKLDHLKTLGVNTLQLMPVAHFAGDYGWGYETVFPYAVHSPYGAPDELKALIKRCHLNGIAVILDVSFGHLTQVDALKPFHAPFFSEKYKLPQGNALNFDEKFSFGVRDYYIQCALSWLEDYRADGLRINDAHSIIDQTPIHFLEELSRNVKEYAAQNNRHCVLITEDNRNTLLPVLPYNKGGYNLDALYNEDFCNALIYRLTNQNSGYMKDYEDPQRLVSAMQYGFAYRGELSPHRQRQQGRNHSELKGCKLVVYTQKHSPDSDHCECCRIIDKAGFEAAKLSAGATILSPFVPMIFMGDEYGETNSFDQSRIQDCAEREDEPTSLLQWENVETAQGKAMLTLYRKLLRVRRDHPAIHEPCRSRCQVQEIIPGLILSLRNSKSVNGKYAAIAMNFGRTEVEVSLLDYLPAGIWTTEIYSAEMSYGGNSPALPAILPQNEKITLARQSFALFFFTTVS